MRRRHAGPRLGAVLAHLQLEAAEHRAGGVGRDLDAEQRGDPRQAQRDGRLLRPFAGRVGPGRAAAAGQLEQQPERAQGRPLEPDPVVDAALEAVARVGGVAVATGGRADPRRREPGRLEQQVVRARVHHRLRAAHHAGEGLRRAGVGDHQVVGRQQLLRAVERGHRLVALGPADHHPALGQAIAVERVQRLAALHQHEVGHVDDVADRPQADAVQADPHPQRRWLNGHALEDIPEIAPAQLRRRDRHQPRGVRRLGPVDVRRPQRQPELGADVAGHADVPERVGTVRRHAQLEDRVDDPGHAVDQAVARAPVLRQHEDPAVVGADLELGLGADHALRRHAAQLAGRDRQAAREDRADRRERHLAAERREVAGAAHDLDDTCPIEQLDDRQLVGLRVRRLAADLADHDRAHALAHGVDGLDLEAQAGEQAGVSRGLALGRPGRERRFERALGEHFTEPLVRDLHGNCSRNRTSPSNMCRRCGTACCDIVMRSTPKPNAQPV
ncbi:hypothetical protein OV079_10885 [Nannocystis pusilla]|uniref:Uncharacterized protein n=1 Tax=Nannocystis pusilla TaxID=889268 RepID=A0A9X3IW42_9BACT|nr:hypothetical protein [Nannocystis pusilla]MCY1006056.1 hypothetical protein [Nannocystis pusilla]